MAASATCASVPFGLPVMARILCRSFEVDREVGAVLHSRRCARAPKLHRRDEPSPDRRELCVASRRYERVPVELSVPTSFCATSADLPIPVTTIRPRQRKTASATWTKRSSRRSATWSNAVASGGRSWLLREHRVVLLTKPVLNSFRHPCRMTAQT